MKSTTETVDPGIGWRRKLKTAQQPGWKTTNPPKDGSHFIAKGRIIAEDEFGCTVSPYLGEIWWGGEYWMYSSQSWPLSVTCSPEETFYIDFWIELPDAETALDGGKNQ